MWILLLLACISAANAGACCGNNDVCLEAPSASACSVLGGSYHGDESVCYNGFCSQAPDIEPQEETEPSPGGSCCGQTMETCLQVPSGEMCAILGGEYLGDNTTCINNICGLREVDLENPSKCGDFPW